MTPSISLKDVHVSYPIGRDDTLKNLVLDLFRRRRQSPVPTVVNALRGITLNINAGERVGIIGRNGAGKSTLLRVMGGLFPATTGEVVCEGRIGCLISLGQGFERNATGWDNIKLRSLVLGATHAQIREKTPMIAEFSGLGEFLNLPMRCYSNGMFARLGFAISTAYDPELLLVDEVMGAGDEEFQRRARVRMDELMKRSALLVLVTHSLAFVTELCTRAIFMKDGTVAYDGDPKTAVAAYRADVQQSRTMSMLPPDPVPSAPPPASPETAPDPSSAA